MSLFTKTTIITKFLETINRENLIDKNDTIIVGASGGADSQFLIFLLNEIKEKYKLNIILAHLNHMHREDANDDENLVRNTAKKLGLEFFSTRKSMDKYAKENNLSSEHAGRILRYNFFEKIARNYENSKIAVAHNMDDQAETVLMRIIRGTGTDGLRAMEYKNGLVIRPIMDFSKKDIIDFLDYEKFPYHTDYTNFQRDYTRNKIRLDIIPSMEKINPNFKDSLISLSEIAKDDYSILKDVENYYFENLFIKKDENMISFDKKKLKKLSKALKYRIIRKAIGCLHTYINDFSRENIISLANVINLENGKKIIKDDLVFYNNYQSLDIYIKNSKINNRENKIVIVDKNSQINFSNFKIKTKIISINEFSSFKQYNKGKSVYFDYDLIYFPIKIRSRENGDKFNYNNGKEKKIKDYFIDEKIDKRKRDEIPLVFINDKLVWIIPFRRSDDFKITKETKKILVISAEEL